MVTLTASSTSTSGGNATLNVTFSLTATSISYSGGRGDISVAFSSHAPIELTLAVARSINLTLEVT